MDAISEIAGAVNKGLGIIAPLIAEHQNQAFEGERRETLREYQSVVAEGNPIALGSFCYKLLSSAGLATGPVGGSSIEVPVEYFNQLVIAVADKVKLERQLNSLLGALKAAVRD